MQSLSIFVQGPQLQLDVSTLEACAALGNISGLGCPQNKQKKISVQTAINRNKICFAFVSVCFVKPKRKNVGLFRCFEPISKQPK
jgi:hypothetical protein